MLGFECILCLLVGLAGLLSCTALCITITEFCNVASFRVPMLFACSQHMNKKDVTKRCNRVAVVVSLHLLVEYLGLTTAGLCDQLAVQKCEDRVADRLQLVLNLVQNRQARESHKFHNRRHQILRNDAPTTQSERKRHLGCHRPEHKQDHQNTDVSVSDSHLLAVLLCIGGVLSVALGRLLPCLISLPTHQFTDKKPSNREQQHLNNQNLHYPSLPPQLLHDARDDAPCSTARAHRVLVGHGQQVALLHGKLAVSIAHILHVIGHLVVALCLLGKLGLRTLQVRHDKSAQRRLAASQPRGKVHVLLTRRHGCKRPWGWQQCKTLKLEKLCGLGHKMVRCTVHNACNLSYTGRPCQHCLAATRLRYTLSAFPFRNITSF